MNNFGQPGLPQQQALSLMERPMWPPVTLQPGYIPQVNIPVAVPQQLAQLSGLLLFEAIGAIQAEATNNRPRLLLFNVMAENGYSNARFADFMSKFVELIDMMLSVVQNRPPEQIVHEAAKIFTQFKMAQLVQQSQILAYLDQATNHQIGLILNNFQTWIMPIENAYNAKMQQMQFAQQRQAGGGGFGNFGQPQGGALPAGVGFGASSNSRFGPPPNNVPVGHGQPSNFGGVNPALGNFTGAAPPPPPPPPAAPVNWRDSVGHKPTLSIMAPSATAEVITIGNAPAPATPLPSNVTVVEAVRAPSEPLKAQIEQLEALPRAKAPVNKLVYDLNMFTPEFLLSAEGKQVLQLKEKTVDREQHLGRPNHTPAWVKLPTLEEADARLQQARDAEPQGPVIDLVEVANDQIIPAVSRDDTWAKVEVGIQTTRKQTGKVVAACAATLIIKPQAMSESIVKFLDELLACQNLADAGKLLKTALAQAVGDDHVALTEFNRRLTERVNRAVSKELQLDFGTITDFAEDAVDQHAAISEDFGPSVLEAFVGYSQRILKDALFCIAPGTELYKSVASGLFGDLLDNASTYLPLLGERLILSAVDLNSAELRMELGSTKVSNLLIQESAPLAYELVKALREARVYEANMRLLLRTTDGVIFQIDHGVYNEDAMLLSVVG